jgi:hypothetical protein
MQGSNELLEAKNLFDWKVLHFVWLLGEETGIGLCLSMRQE